MDLRVIKPAIGRGIGNINSPMYGLKQDYPTAFFNGLDFTNATYIGGPTYVADNTGVLVAAPAGYPGVQGARLVGSTFVDTDASGNAIVPSTPQRTRTGNADFSAYTTDSHTWKRYSTANPLTMPGWLCEPARTNYALNSATPATHTTGTVNAGTYTLWQEGTGSIVATAGTAVGTFGTASNGTPATITITTGGTVVLTATGINTWVQLESGLFKTSRILTTTAAATRAGTVNTYSSTGEIKTNDIGLFFTLVPRASNQTSVIFNTQSDVNNRLTIYQYPEYIEAVVISNGLKMGGCIMMYTHKKDVPIQLALSKHSTDGMRISIREYSSGTWGNWINGGISVMTANLSLGTTYTLGSGLGFTFCGNISEFYCYILPSIITNGLTWIKDKLGVATAAETSDPTIMTFTSTGVASVASTLQTSGSSTDDTITVVWGDGSSNTYASVSDTAANHTYASSSVVYRVKIQGKDDSRLKKYYNITPSLNISGTLSMPSGMTYFYCTGSNTLSGILSIPPGMIYFNCVGSNTLSGILSIPSGMAYFTCAGFNTLSGTLSIPSGMTYFTCTGFNTLSSYISSSKANRQNRFYLGGLNTLSSSNVDSIIIDYAAVSTWIIDKTFYLQGNASNRTSASDAAYATLQTKGLTTLSVD